MKIERFEDIESWQLARALMKELYAAARQGDFARDFPLRDQILRAGGSAMHNIAEGFDSGSNAEFVRFLQYAKRSCSEVQSQLYVALDQGYVSADRFEILYEGARTIRSKVGCFIDYLQKSGRR